MVHINSIYSTNNNGQIKVLSKENSDWYVVEFLPTGTIKKARGYAILRGEVRDPYAISLCNVACTGDVKTKGKNEQYYTIWHGMINRCYNKHNKRFDAYNNVKVCERWLVFENFLHDCPLIEGFDEEKFLNHEIVLDKDKKQRFLSEKVYSRETCCWISASENNRMQDNQQRMFVAVSPSGEIFESINITEFASQHGLERRHISSALHNRIKSTKGWKFRYKEIV